MSSRDTIASFHPATEALDDWIARVLAVDIIIVNAHPGGKKSDRALAESEMRKHLGVMEQAELDFTYDF
jgi:hypothetical protein